MNQAQTEQVARTNYEGQDNRGYARPQLIEQPTPPQGPANGSGAFTVTIQSLNYGYLVNVGCKAIAIETKEKLIEKLMTYFNDPQGTEQKFYNGELFK